MASAVNTAVTMSMTGSGVAMGATEVGQLRVEVRSVNGRSLALKQRLCAEVAGLEPAFDEVVRRTVARGNLTLVVDRVGHSQSFDRGALQQLVQDLRALARDLGINNDLSLRDVLTLAGSTRAQPLAREMPPGVAAVLDGALADLQRHRAADGTATVAAMLNELDGIDRLRATAIARAPSIVADYRARLLQRIGEFVAAQGLRLEAADLIREVAVFAEHSDVGEELQRLGAHADEVRALLRRGGVIGRKLDFLLQEAMREANTLGSKSPDVAMAHRVVELKASIDRLKEQAANLE